MAQQILVTEDNWRIDKYIANKMGNISRSRVQSLIKSGNITLLPDDEIVHVARMAKVGEKYQVNLPQIISHPNFSSSEKLDIIYEDQHLAVINKPVGLTVHGGVGTKNDTLADLLLTCYGPRNLSENKERPGIVHRLDKNTSGLMVIAKNNNTHVKLAEAISNRTLIRKYIAIVNGLLKEKSGTITTNIAPNPKDRRKMHVVKSGGKRAITHYTVLSTRQNKYSIVECSLETGRTHQIRVHMKHLGHSIIGDATYGQESKLITRQALHASCLTFTHPETYQVILCETKPPDDMKIFFDK